MGLVARQGAMTTPSHPARRSARTWGATLLVQTGRSRCGRATSALARISDTASTTLPRTSRRWTMPRRRVAVATGTCLVARFYLSARLAAECAAVLASAVSHSEDAVAVWWHALS